MNNIAAIVVFYNPIYEDVLKNLESYATHCDQLIIVDNSTQCTKKLINTIDSKYNLCYINNNDNLGIATALNIGCDKAIQLGYDWTLTMDQDSEFVNFKQYKECLFMHYNSKEIAIIAVDNICLTSYKKELSKFFDKKFIEDYAENHMRELIAKSSVFQNIEVDFVITSGNFLNLKLFNKIGRFEDKLFIDEVDFDYCAKCLINNYKIIKFINIKIIHQLGNYVNGINQHNYMRKYYIFRNNLYMASKYGKKFPTYSYKKVLILFKKSLSYILRKEEDKYKKVKSMLMAISDFLINNYGNKFK
jgi:rhamnosyltransferase